MKLVYKYGTLKVSLQYDKLIMRKLYLLR